MKFLSLLFVKFCLFALMALYTASSSAANEFITVTTIADQPWVSVKTTKARPDSNEDFEGFIPDLLKLVAQRIGANYSLKLVDDKKYGQLDSATNTWNGMVGEIVRGEADVAAAALTMSAERAAVIDFTQPFMTFDSAILLLKTEDGGHERIASVADLIDRPDMTFGLIRGGLTEATFHRLQDEGPYKQMAARMRQNATLNVDSTSEGVAKVRSSGGKFALILEGPTAEFVANTAPCDLHFVGVKLESRSYAWGLKKGFRLKDPINVALAAVKDSGELDSIDRKWRRLDVCSSSAADPGFESRSIRLVEALSLILMATFYSM